MRLIDADKLIQFVDYSADLGGLWGRMLTAFKTVIKEIVDVQPTIEPEPHWILCSEKLPDKMLSTYLVTDNEGDVYICGWASGKWVGAPREIIAWMPLPEPYRGEEK